MQCVAEHADPIHGFTVCCSMLQCVVGARTVCCSALQSVAVCCSALQCITVCCRSSNSVLQYFAVYCRACGLGGRLHCVLQYVAVRCSMSQCVAVCHRKDMQLRLWGCRCCSAVQCVAVRCSALQCIAKRTCNCGCGAVVCCITIVRCSVLQCVAVCGSVL